MKFKQLIFIRSVLTFIVIINVITFLNAQDRVRNNAVYFYHDNDVFRFKHNSDQFYSFGLFLGYRQTIKEQSGFNKAFFFVKNKESSKLLYGANLSVKGFTPEFEKNLNNAEIRPFAGITVLEQNLSSAQEKRFYSLGLSLGARGQISGAEWIQDNFHRLIDSPVFEGWENQLSNKFIYGVSGTYAFSVPVAKWIQIVPESKAAIGNFQTYLQQGVIIRAGIFNSSLSNTKYYGTNLNNTSKKAKNEYFLFAKGFGRISLIDTTLGKEAIGNTTNALNKRNRMAGFDFGLMMQSGPVGIRLSRHLISADSNFSTRHTYGSLGLSYLF
ncbi:lipid A-modifier LpxR family protein [Aquiflexum sp.]|uniref:lipid A-modifier LpxR family protein n=1 Tax=Aquiflexum sp. TaxID=1872584 RepID=UPI00359391AB